MQKPTVGRIVHFYNTSLALSAVGPNDISLNGQSVGPYPALVVQAFPGPYVNLLVFAYGGNWVEGSVSERDETMQSMDRRYWVWPPRE